MMVTYGKCGGDALYSSVYVCVCVYVCMCVCVCLVLVRCNIVRFLSDEPERIVCVCMLSCWRIPNSTNYVCGTIILNYSFTGGKA